MSNTKKPKILAVTTTLLLMIGVVGYFIFANKDAANKSVDADNNITLDSKYTESVLQTSDEDYRYFSGNDFLRLYEGIAYPNTQHLSLPPYITGHTAADERIRSIASSRGYTLRSVPVASITKTDEPRLRIGDDDLLQEKALAAWRDLKAAANADSIPLELNSGYRSVEAQRELFLSRLHATGVTYSEIAAGSADSLVVEVLRWAALPGYSRHHTGYTIDVVCANGVQSFETTTCFKWLSDNNYLNAKKHGWIPSYPEGVDNQGPEPEPWEYVWVGQRTLLKE